MTRVSLPSLNPRACRSVWERTGTAKGVQVALLFLSFHKWLCGPLANSRFHHCPSAQHRPNSRLEAAYHRADKAIEQIVELFAAA
jgi:hypothetical protein